MIISYVVDVTGPAGARWYGCTDTDLTPAMAEECAAQRYCIDTQIGLGRRGEVRVRVDSSQEVQTHPPRPVYRLDA